MDYFIGFLLGYYVRVFLKWLKNLAEINIPDNYINEDWDFYER